MDAEPGRGNRREYLKKSATALQNLRRGINGRKQGRNQNSIAEASVIADENGNIDADDPPQI
ncbi:MAG: hypothetical protein ACLRSW_15630 [Christensenellaceae bacterium]